MSYGKTTQIRLFLCIEYGRYKHISFVTINEYECLLFLSIAIDFINIIYFANLIIHATYDGIAIVLLLLLLLSSFIISYYSY